MSVGLITGARPGQWPDAHRSTAPVRYYKGRWREPIASDGIFVARRPQAYGAPVWCAVELADGVPQAVLDLPIDSSIAPGWDDARKLQAALDAERGSPRSSASAPSRRPRSSSSTSLDRCRRGPSDTST